MGIYGNRASAELKITRAQQDEWALRSHQLAVKAQETGLLREEIVPVAVPQKKGDPILIERDEAPRKDTSLEQLSKLTPIFDHDGTVTAGNAPGVNDGACALVLMRLDRAQKEGRKPLATIIGHTAVALEARDFPKTPGLVINELLQKTGKTINDIDLFEINEAFATVALATNQIANLPPEKVNVNGGAIALGHPIGASGARIIITLLHELKRRGGGIGIAAICSGGGQGDAIMIEV
jgi:acetyl-CoA C-acetyltransferase